MSNSNDPPKSDPASEPTAFYPASRAIDPTVEPLKAENSPPPESDVAFPRQPLGTPSFEGVSGPGPSTPAKHPAGRNWVLIGGVAALVLLVAGLGGSWWYFNTGAKPIAQSVKPPPASNPGGIVASKSPTTIQPDGKPSPVRPTTP